MTFFIKLFLSKAQTLRLPVFNITLFFVTSLFLNGCSTFAPVQPEFSSLNNNSNHITQPGDLIWIDLLSKDVSEAQSFYSTLFGWEYVTNETGYISIMDGGQAIGGMLLETHIDANSRWMPMFYIADSQQGSQLALDKMGRVPTHPTQLTQNLTYAVIADPQGASFGVMSAPDGIENVAYASKQTIDVQLWSHDRQQAFRFYQPLFSLKMKPAHQSSEQIKEVVVESKPVKLMVSESAASRIPEEPPQISMRRIFSSKTGSFNSASAAPISEKKTYKTTKPTFGIPNPYKLTQSQFGIDLSMSVIELPWQDIATQWVVLFTVPQPDMVLSQVAQNGGRILINFNDPLSDGSVAVIEDPSGGIFMIQAKMSMTQKGEGK